MNFHKSLEEYVFGCCCSVNGLSRWCSDKKSSCQCRRGKRGTFNFWVLKMPWSKKWQPMAVFFPGKHHGLSGLAGYSLWGFKELDTTE